jgi:hypothetical protein
MTTQSIIQVENICGMYQEIFIFIHSIFYDELFNTHSEQKEQITE